MFLDINECAAATEYCVNGTCTNWIGSFQCNCTSGFEGQNCNIAIGKIYKYVFGTIGK